jgi:hypothetical protein
MECDEVVTAFAAAAVVQARGQRFGRPVAGDERFPRRLAARLAVIRGASLETQVETTASKAPWGNARFSASPS